MRKKLLICKICLICLLLTGCTARDPLTEMAAPEVTGRSAIPAPYAEDTVEEGTATLWFRLTGEPLLAPESRVIEVSPTEPYETSLLRLLTAGPDIAHTELSALFPTGTRVISTHREGRRLFVTLSRHIMNDLPGENALSAEEGQLRRRLAMQAIAATATENCDVDEVIVLVEQGAAVTDSLRLRERYYRLDLSTDALAEPLRRDGSLLLTHGTAMDLILRAWSEQDYARLYRFLADTDPATGQGRPDWDAFLAQMAALPDLAAFRLGSGSVHGDRAVFTADLTLMEDGRTWAETDCVFRLTRERGLWRIGCSQFSGRWGVSP